MADESIEQQDEQDELTRWQAVRQAVDAAGWAVAENWRVAPGLTVLAILANLAIAAVPGLQVVSVGWLARAIEYDHGVLGCVALLAGLVALSQVTGMVNNFFSNRLALAQHLRQQDRLLSAICRTSPQVLATKEANAEIQASRGALRDASHHIFSVLTAGMSVFAAVGVCAALFRIDPLAGLLVMLALVPMMWSASWIAKAQDKAWKTLGEYDRHVGYAVEQLVYQRTGTELVTLGSGHVMERKARTYREKFNALMAGMFTRMLAADSAAAAVTAALLAGALWALARSGAGTAGVASGIMGVLAGMNATQQAGFSLGFLVSDAPKINRFRRFLAEAPDSEPQLVVPVVHELTATGVTVTYPGKDLPSLVEGGITARRGEMVALVGINGAGKTTMVNAILGIVDADSGTVTIDGVDASAMSPQRRLSHFGLLTQEFGRYELTVREAVMLGTPETDVSDERIWAALAAARIDDVVRGMDKGLDTQLGQQWGGVGLSGGQWQRIALARIHLRGAGIWVLDEPTSAIDAEAEQQIFDELHRGKAGRITLVVSHRAWTLRRMDRIHVFQDGHIVESGSYDELLAARGRFAEIFAEQA